MKLLKKKKPFTCLNSSITEKNKSNTYIYMSKKSPESISSKPYFSQTKKPQKPESNEAKAPDEVSN